MDFNDSKEEAAFRSDARQWLELNHAEFAKEYPLNSSVSAGDNEVAEAAKAWQKRKHESGWGCLTWPTEFGGRGASVMEATIFAEEESRLTV